MMNSNRRWVSIAFLALGFLLWIITSKFVTWLFDVFRISEANVELLGESFTLTTAFGMLVAASLTIYAFRHKELNTLSGEVVVELKKVTWPTVTETRGATVVVIFTVFVMSVFLGLFDFIWSNVMDWLYPNIQSV